MYEVQTMTVYVDNKKLMEDIIQWKKDRLNGVRMSDSLGLAIMNIVNGFTEYYRFRSYSPIWKEAMVGDAIETLIKRIHNFDETKFDNAHAYVTWISARVFFHQINLEKKKEATKNRYFVECVYDSDDDDMNEMVDPAFYLDIVDKVNSYEMNVKKPKQKEKVGELDWLYDIEDDSDEVDYENKPD